MLVSNKDKYHKDSPTDRANPSLVAIMAVKKTFQFQYMRSQSLALRRYDRKSFC